MCRPTAAVALAFLVILPAAVAAQDIAAFYQQNCAACHTVGGGPQGGPDLKGVSARRDRDWLVRFLVNPPAFEKDPEVLKMIAAADGMVMPPVDDVTPERARALITYIDEQSGEKPESADAPVAASAAVGRDLFMGHAPLAAHGPPCVSCHDLGALGFPRGGSLGPDLTATQARLGGARGLAAWLTGAPTPVMRAVYHDKALTAAEAHSLAAFVGEAGESPSPNTAGTLLSAAAGIAGAAVVVIAFAGRRRFRAVRRPLVTRMRAYTRVVARHAPGEHAVAHDSHATSGGAR